MTWWDIANDPSVSNARRAAAAFGCGVFPWACLAQEGAERAQHEAGEQAGSLRASLERQAGGGGGLFGDAGGLLEDAGGAVAAPIDAYANVLKWSAVILGLIVLAVVLGLVVWFVILPYAKGGPKRD